jgi:cytochrome c oxidase subunit 2
MSDLIQRVLHFFADWTPMTGAYMDTASTFAKDIDGVIALVFALVGFWFILSFGTFIWLILRFRAKDGVRARWITGEVPSQKRWVAWPHYLIMVCDIFIIVGAIWVWYGVKQDLPPAQQTVRVIGQQWAWTFVHPGPDGMIDTADDIAKVDELHVQNGVLYHYKLESRDVLHNFSVPVFRLKQDAIPGRTITGWFEPIKTGEWDVQCAEICGIGHGIMGARIFVESPEEHAAWMSEHTDTRAVASAR